MTFSFFPTIPSTNNDPADDQPLMQTNFASINSIVGVDHVSFNVSGGGQHEKITFNANNVPATPVSPPVLFTNDVESTPHLFFYSGDAAHSSTQFYYGPDQSSVLLMAGMIMKFGTISSPPLGNANLSFTQSFPNNIFTVVLTGQRSNSGSLNSVYVNSAVPATVSGFAYTTTSANFTFLNWIAIGN